MALGNNNGNSTGRKRWILAGGGLVLAVIVLAAFVSMRNGEVSVRAAQVERGTIRTFISTNGKVEAVDNFEAHAPMATTVKRVYVKEGQRVKKGQLLLQLEDGSARSEAARAAAQLKAAQADIISVSTGGTREEVLTTQADLVKAQTELDSAQRNLEALKRLHEKGAASAGEVLQAENRLKAADAQVNLLQQRLKQRYSTPEVEKVKAQENQARAALEAAQALLRDSNIRAPRDGVVYSLPVREGLYVNSGDLLIQEADLSRVRVRMFVDEPDIGRLAPGQRIEITWDGLPGRIWPGTVTSVPAEVRPRGSRNVGELTCVVDNSDLRLLPNVNVGVSIITSEHHDVLVVPRESVRQGDGKPYVYQIVNGQLRRREIETGVSNLTRVEVTRGLAERDLVAQLAETSTPLRDGMSVKVAK
jgi:HlyD family secretion protein